jgi:hypothetical protein
VVNRVTRSGGVKGGFAAARSAGTLDSTAPRETIPEEGQGLSLGGWGRPRRLVTQPFQRIHAAYVARERAVGRSVHPYGKAPGRELLTALAALTAEGAQAARPNG